MLQLLQRAFPKIWSPTGLPVCSSPLVPVRQVLSLFQRHASVDYMARMGPFMRKISPNYTMSKCPLIRGIVLRTIIRKPKKPNSANRKCVRVKLSNGKEIVAYVPGEGHNLQEHNAVLIKGGRCQDLIGVKHKVVRGMLDCAPVMKKTG